MKQQSAVSFHDDRDEDVAKNLDQLKSALALFFSATLVTGCTMTQHGDANFQSELKSVSPERYAAVFEDAKRASTRLPTVRPANALARSTRPVQHPSQRPQPPAPRASIAMPRGATLTNVAPTVESPIPSASLAANPRAPRETGRLAVVAPPRVSVNNIPGRESELAAVLQNRQPTVVPRDSVGRRIEQSVVADSNRLPKPSVEDANVVVSSVVPPPPVVLDPAASPDAAGNDPRAAIDSAVANSNQSPNQSTQSDASIPTSPDAGIVGLIEGEFFDEPEPTSIKQVADRKPVQSNVFDFDGRSKGPTEFFDQTVALQQPGEVADPLQVPGPKKPYNPPAESSRPAGDQRPNADKHGLTPITSISLDASAKPDPNTQNELQFPDDIAKRELAKHGTLQHTTGTSRDWMLTEYSWEAPVMSHNPLYFEQENLERFGLSSSKFFQPIYSGAHFYSSMLVLPFKTAAKPYSDRVYAMGHYRPGNNVPPKLQDMKFDLTAMSYQGAVSTLLIFMFP